MKVYIIGSSKATQDFIAKATENSRGNLRVEHGNVSNDIDFKQLTAYQLSLNTIKDADYVVFLDDKDFGTLSTKVDNAPCTLYFGDETPEAYIKAQIKFELENASALAQTPTVSAAAAAPVEAKRSSFMNSFMTIFGKRKDSVRGNNNAVGLELVEFEQNSPKQN